MLCFHILNLVSNVWIHPLAPSHWHSGAIWKHFNKISDVPDRNSLKMTSSAKKKKKKKKQYPNSCIGFNGSYPLIVTFWKICCIKQVSVLLNVSSLNECADIWSYLTNSLHFKKYYSGHTLNATLRCSRSERESATACFILRRT